MPTRQGMAGKLHDTDNRLLTSEKDVNYMILYATSRKIT